LNRGRHLCSAGRPSGWALAHILVLFKISVLCKSFTGTYLLLGVQLWHLLMKDRTVLSATHKFIYTRNEPYLPLTPAADRATLWLVLISHATEARQLSWPGWLGEILRWFVARPKMVTHPRICCVNNCSHCSFAVNLLLNVY